jgi:hypothetical protein
MALSRLTKIGGGLLESPLNFTGIISSTNASFSGIVTTSSLIATTIGIGTTNPTSTLHLSGIGTTSITGDTNRIRIGDYHWDNVYTSIHAKKVRSEWWLEQNSNDNDGVDLIFYKTRGTPNAEIPVQVGDNIFRLSGRTFKPNAVGVGSTISLSDWSESAQIAFDVDEISGNNVLGRIDFRTQNTSRMVIKASGNVGIGTTNPGATLQVTPTSTSIAGIFSGTTSSDMVRITQTGTGNALVVEDETNPDASAFVVTGIGSVGIGTTNPQKSLHIYTADGDIKIGDITEGTGGTDAGVIFTGLGSNTSAIFTEVDGQILSYGINCGQITGIETARAGGIFRLDSRIGSSYGDSSCFVVKGRSLGTTTEYNAIVVGLNDGNTYLSPVKGNVLVGTSTSTGTASQPLQVTGGAYVSGNLGVGNTLPTSKLVVQGDARFVSSGQGDVTITHSSLVSTIKGTATVQLALGANNNEVIRINNSSQVGIGTASASPAFTADIAGDARVTSTNKMRFGGTAGTTNFYIQYNSTANSLDFVAG